MRTFQWINVVQWFVIAVVGALMSRIGLAMWVLPMAMLVVGLHFFALARVFHTPTRHITGVALVLVPALYPFVAAHRPSDPIGCSVYGIVLWIGAVVMILR